MNSIMGFNTGLFCPVNYMIQQRFEWVCHILILEVFYNAILEIN